MLVKELDSSFEGTFFASLYFRVALSQSVNLSPMSSFEQKSTHYIATDGEAVHDTGPVGPLVARSELSASEDCICLLLRGNGELGVGLA